MVERLERENDGSLAQKRGPDELDSGVYPWQMRGNVSVGRVADGEVLPPMLRKTRRGWGRENGKSTIRCKTERLKSRKVVIRMRDGKRGRGRRRLDSRTRYKPSRGRSGCTSRTRLDGGWLPGATKAKRALIWVRTELAGRQRTRGGGGGEQTFNARQRSRDERSPVRKRGRNWRRAGVG